MTAIGLGGIGSGYLRPVAQIMKYQLKTAPLLELVDGGHFERKNLERQDMGPDDENLWKVDVHARKLRASTDVGISTIPKYIASDPKESDSVRADLVVKDRSIVLVSVDNDPARLLVSKIARTRTDIAVIYGGNDLHNGYAYLYLVLDGMEVTKPIEEARPQIQTPDPADKNPGDLTCEERQKLPGGEQIVSTNHMAASWMLAHFRKVSSTVPLGKERMAEKLKKNSLVMFDVNDHMSATAYSHISRRPRNLVERRA